MGGQKYLFFSSDTPSLKAPTVHMRRFPGSHMDCSLDQRHLHSVEQIVVLPLTYFWRFAEISLFNLQKSLDKCHAWQMPHKSFDKWSAGNTKPSKSRIQILWLASQHFEFCKNSIPKTQVIFPSKVHHFQKQIKTSATLNLMCNSKSTQYMIFRFIWKLKDKRLWWFLH